MQLKFFFNQTQLRIKRGNGQHYNKCKQMRYFRIINIAEVKLTVVLRLPSLTKVEVGNFALLHFLDGSV